MTRNDLQQFLSRQFNLSELRDLCFTLNIEHENFGDKLGLSDFIIALISYCERHEKTNALIAECRRQRPNFATDGFGAIYTNVPSLEKKIIGRDALVDELAAQLVTEQARALSAEGMGGVGKTTLALVLAHDKRIRQHFVDGVLWAGLGQTADGMAALASWAEALGGDVSQVLQPADRAREVQRRIGSRKMLLVIDDAWSLEVAQHLKCGGPNCCHLLTTRDAHIAKQFALGVAGGVSAVPPLDDLAAFALLRTLAPEACAADPAAAQDLAQRAGGLPLVVEVLGGYLAESKHTMFPKSRKASFAKLADPRARLALATQRLGDKTKLSLQAILELSLNDFAEDTRRAWFALGAFAHKPATFSLEAAERVCQTDEETLATFVDRNLLEKVDDTTLALHQTLAEVARARDGLDEATTRHRQFYLALANKDRNDWRTIGAAYAQINFAWENAPKDESALAFIGVTHIFQTLRGLWHDQIEWIECGIEICRTKGKRKDEAVLMNNIGLVYESLGQHDKALDCHEYALSIREEVNDRVGLATTLNNIGLVYSELGQRDKALANYERTIPIREEVGDWAGLATTLNNIGLVYHGMGDFDKALAYFKRALLIFEEVHDQVGLAQVFDNIGGIHFGKGEIELALDYGEHALQMRLNVGDRRGEGHTHANIGYALAVRGKLKEAEVHLTQAVKICREIGNPNFEKFSRWLEQVRAAINNPPHP